VTEEIYHKGESSDIMEGLIHWVNAKDKFPTIFCAIHCWSY